MYFPQHYVILYTNPMYYLIPTVINVSISFPILMQRYFLLHVFLHGVGNTCRRLVKIIIFYLYKFKVTLIRFVGMYNTLSETTYFDRNFGHKLEKMHDITK